MNLIIEGDPKEIAALVLAVQERQGNQRATENLAEAICDTLLEEAEKFEKNRMFAEVILPYRREGARKSAA